jgi:F-type H+-transporting ATPase subunit gamma
MKRESDLKRHLRSLKTLADAVGAMKSLSARHFREARGAVEPARKYREGVERILASTGASLAAGDGPAGLLVIGGELGLCGAYNAHLIVAAVTRRKELGPGPTVCVGRRAAALLHRQRVETRTVYSGPASVRGIPELLLRLAEDVLTIYVRERLSSLEVVSSQFGGVGAELPTCTRLLPLEAVRAEQEPASFYVSSAYLASAAVREFLYITIYDLLLDSLASEHGARLLTTQSAEKWLEARTNRLRRHLAATRRETSTQEVIEIAGGARTRARAALTDGSAR